MHKIDRDKLREALNESFDVLNRTTIRQPAENWLEISDPDYEPTWEMLRAGLDAAIEDNEFLAEYISTDDIEVIFKAMIAKAGK